MILVGITGSIGSGKTTLAGFLSDGVASSAHWESWQLVAEVATALRASSETTPKASDIEAINTWLAPLPSILLASTKVEVRFEQVHLTEERLTAHPENYKKLLEYLKLLESKPELQLVQISEDNKDTFRSILQWLGGYLVKMVDPTIWYAEIIRRIQSTKGLDLATIGGVRFPGDANCVVKAGGSIISIERPTLVIQDQQDLTERERSQIVPNIRIINNAGLEQLQVCARQVMKDLQGGNSRPSYTASDFTA